MYIIFVYIRTCINLLANSQLFSYNYLIQHLVRIKKGGKKERKKKNLL